MQHIAEISLLLADNQLSAAQQECTKALQQNPNDPEVLQLQGIICAKLGDLTAAIHNLSLAIKLDPTQALYHNNISNAYKLTGQLDLAIRHLHESLRLNPNHAESYNNLAALYYTQCQFSQAIPLLEKAIRLNPYSWEAHYNLANCYIKTDKSILAISHYEKVLKLQPQHNNAKQNLAMALVNNQDYTAALPLLIEVAADNPQHAELQGHLATAYLEVGKSNEALTQYEIAVGLDPSRAEWLHNLAVLYLRAKKTDKAKEYFERSLKIEANNPTAQHMLQALNNEIQSSTAPETYVSDLFDQYAGYYNQHVRNNLNYQTPQLLRQAIGKFINDQTALQNVLDLGCGTGLCGIYFRDLAQFLIGVDLSSGMLAHAKSLGAYDGLCRCNILQAIPGQNQYVFDLILAADVFVYIGDLLPLFALLISALRIAGKIAFTVEELPSGEFKLLSTGRYAHSKEYIGQLAQQLGLKILVEDRIVLRQQEGEAISGLLYVLSI